jgi:ElaB/YqjD/DUF883 family membrane-anchored ribosome-binding protein
LRKLAYLLCCIVGCVINVNTACDKSPKFREKQMTLIKKLSTSAITLVAVLGLTACSEEKAETAGEKVDEMVHEAGKAAEKTGDKVDDMVDSAGNKLGEIKDDASEKLGKMKEDAGNKLDEIKDSATSKFKDMKKDAGNAVEDACEKVKEGVEAEDDDC